VGTTFTVRLPLTASIAVPIDTNSPKAWYQLQKVMANR
jgi:hypothetical protein